MDKREYERELAKRKQKAVKVLTVWAQEGGGTERFHNTVNSVLDEDDREVEPLLTGLINLSADLLHTASQATGTSVDELLRLIKEEADREAGDA